MFNKNHLGHNLEPLFFGSVDNQDYYYCNRCKIRIWAFTSYSLKESKDNYWTLVDFVYKNALSCDETIIKNIIE